MNIFIAKLSSSTTSDDLKTLFEEYGEVTSANVITDRMTGYSKKFGFVEMKNDDEANKAIKELDNCQYDNADIVVKQARPKGESPRREERYSNYR
jgi:RNA recognition motif-containing protein